MSWEAALQGLESKHISGLSDERTGASGDNRYEEVGFKMTETLTVQDIQQISQGQYLPWT